MPLDTSFIGREYPTTAPYEVSREKIREFADAVGALDPVHRDPAEAHARGYLDVVAPPTFPVIVSMRASQQIIDDPALGIDYSRVVHGDQRFRYTRPVQAGDRLISRCVVEDISSRGGHWFMTTRTELRTVEGESVVDVWSKLVVRGGG